MDRLAIESHIAGQVLLAQEKQWAGKIAHLFSSLQIYRWEKWAFEAPRSDHYPVGVDRIEFQSPSSHQWITTLTYQGQRFQFSRKVGELPAHGRDTQSVTDLHWRGQVVFESRSDEIAFDPQRVEVTGYVAGAWEELIDQLIAAALPWVARRQAAEQQATDRHPKTKKEIDDQLRWRARKFGLVVPEQHEEETHH